MFRKQSTAKVREKLNKALRHDRHAEALSLYDTLEQQEPQEPRWPQRKGDLLVKMKRKPDALKAYERAVDLYAKQGFVARAAAMAKVALTVDPSRVDVLERVDPDAARALRDERKRKREAAAGPEGGTQRRRIREDAATLLPSSGAAADEVRFDDLQAEHGSFELDITDVELLSAEERALAEVERQSGEVAPVSDHPRPRTAAELAQLPSSSLFAEVPQAALRQLIAGSELVKVPAARTLMATGEPADAMYLLIEGEAYVHVPGRRSGPIRVGEGDVLGETCLVDQARRRAVAVTAGPVTALKIPKAVLDSIVASFPEVGDVLLELLSRRLISNLLHTSPLFTAFEPKVRADLARRFEVRRAREHTIILKEGKRSDGLYIPLLGELHVSGSKQSTAQLKLGRPFGQGSLLSEEPSPVTVEVVTEALVLRLPAKRFHEVAQLYPSALEHLQAMQDLSLDDRQMLSLVPPPPE